MPRHHQKKIGPAGLFSPAESEIWPADQTGEISESLGTGTWVRVAAWKVQVQVRGLINKFGFHEKASYHIAATSNLPVRARDK